LQKDRDRTESIDYYRSLASLAVSGNGEKVSNTLDPKAKSKMLSYLPKSLDIWDRALADFARIERGIGSQYKLNEEPKAYAIDTMAISNAFSMQTEKLDFAFKAFSIYYLSVHLLDDLMEDPKKFYSKFTYKDEESKERRIRASGASFIYSSNLTVHNILEGQSKLDPETLLRTETSMNESLARMIKYFNIKNQILAPEKVIEIKNREVSGESTAFFLEFAELEDSTKLKINRHVRQSLVYLGSLTQFTDDLRDLEEDRKDKNINLLIALRGLYGKDAPTEWAKLYQREEQNMLRAIEKSGIDTDINLLKVIPWYPFFAKEKIKGLARK
jgi:hypothetical protein